MEAKKQGEGADDLSMEDILQSIRKIIADEGDETKATDAKAGEVSGGAGASDILELTDIIEDDVEVTPNNEDVLSSIDAALAPEPKPEPEIIPESEPEVAPVLVEPPAPPPATVAPAPIEPAPVEPAPIELVANDREDDGKNDDMEALLSKAAEDAALASLSKLKKVDSSPRVHPSSPVFRSGTTVEDIVEDLLTPMMKEWMDNNLPEIVERIVEREVYRLTRR